MSKFYFHFRQGSALQLDEDGTEFETVEEAYLSAFRAAQDMWHELLVSRQDPRRCSFEVCDGDGRCLFPLPFMEVLEVCFDSKRNQPLDPVLVRTAFENQRRAWRLRHEVTDQLRAARSSLEQSRALLKQFPELG